MYATDETEVFALFFEHPVRFSQGTLLPWGIGAKLATLGCRTSLP
jgi:hypothetical protein